MQLSNLKGRIVPLSKIINDPNKKKAVTRETSSGKKCKCLSKGFYCLAASQKPVFVYTV